MKRIFSVTLIKAGNVWSWSGTKKEYDFEVVAGTAEAAISKARVQAKRDTGWKAGWVVQSLQHRGSAVMNRNTQTYRSLT